MHHTLEVIDHVASNIPNASSSRPDKELVEREFILMINLLQHACKRGLYAFGSKTISREFLSLDLKKIINEYKNIWLLRNRPGGFIDSLAHFNIALRDYQ
jgi:hypothetical protein